MILNNRNQNKPVVDNRSCRPAIIATAANVTTATTTVASAAAATTTTTITTLSGVIATYLKIVYP